MHSSCFIECCHETNFVQSVEKVWNRDASFGSTIPLVKNTVQVGSGSVLSSQDSSKVHNVLFIDSVTEVKRLIGLVFLPFSDFGFQTLSRPNGDTLRKTTALVRVSDNIALAGLICHLGSSARVVTSEHFVSPLGILQVLGLCVGHENWIFLLFALSVIEF